MNKDNFPVYSVSISGKLSWQLHALSTRRCPAPMVSALENGYRDQIKSLANTLNNLNGAGTIHCFPFETMAEFAQQIQVLIEQAQPWESEYAEAVE